MPFNQRTVEPRRVSRLAARGGPAPGEDGGFVVVDGRRYRRPVLFSSLDEVSCHTMINLIHQLSDLSRHAGDMFLDIEMEVCVVLQRSRKIHGRLEALHDEVSKFEPKKVKIRKFT
jgi:hypothetical protein|uniref:Uncharacterized protein n=1 Tax=Gadus morhua TaxID=8049 RepID=A0A8C5BZR8_GADMO